MKSNGTNAIGRNRAPMRNWTKTRKNQITAFFILSLCVSCNVHIYIKNMYFSEASERKRQVSSFAHRAAAECVEQRERKGVPSRWMLALQIELILLDDDGVVWTDAGRGFVVDTRRLGVDRVDLSRFSPSESQRFPIVERVLSQSLARSTSASNHRHRSVAHQRVDDSIEQLRRWLLEEYREDERVR